MQVLLYNWLGMPVSDTLGSRLRAARKQAGLTLSDLARQFGHSIAAVQQWERDRTVPSPDKIIRFAQLTGVDLLWVMTGEKEQKRTEASERDIPPQADGRSRLVPRLTMAQLTAQAQQKTFASNVTTIAHFDCSERAFCVDLDDSSNAPRFEPGDRIIVDPELRPVPGDMVMVLVGSPPRPAFRKYRLETRTRGKVAVLEPLNTDWPTEIETAAKVRILGVMSEHSKPRR